MAVREQNLETTGAVYLTFDISQTSSVDDLKDSDIGKAVQLVSSNRVKATTDGAVVLGKLVALTLTDADNGKRKATVQVTGVMMLGISATYPVIGNRILGAASGKVKQAPVLTGYDPAGGNTARGLVLSVNGTTDCTLLLD
jgi:predicted RecA/RadA family phage recombinase